MSGVRSEDYRDRLAVRPGSMRALAKLAQTQQRVRCRSRSAEQRAMLKAMAVAAVRRRTDSGQLKRVGPREYVLYGGSGGHMPR